MTTIIKTGQAGANLRVRPAGSYIRLLPDGTPVTPINVPTVNAVMNGIPYAWQAIELADNTIGWVVNKYLTSETPPPVTHRQLIGIHVLQDGLNVASALLADTPGITLPSATVVNEIAIVNALLPRTKYVIFRNTPTENNAALPDDPTLAAKQARDYVAHNGGWISAFSGRTVYIQPINEVKIQSVANAAGHNAYWLAYMQALDAMGRKGAIGAYAVGQPEPDQWVTMTTALQYAAENGHLVALHIYCQDGTPIGQLSVDQPDYEGRPARLYNAVPATARPDLVISECAHNFQSGLFEGINETVHFAGQMQAFYQSMPSVVGINLWTFGRIGGREAQSIDTAASALATAITKQEFL